MFTFRNIAHCARQQARGYATASKPQASKAGRNAAIGGGATILALTGWFANAEEKAKEAKDKLVPPTKALKADEWVDLKLVEITKINHNTSVFRFHLPEDNAVSGLEAASCLLTKYKGPNMEKPVIRPYTPVSDDEQRGYIDLLIKKYEGGPMSTHIHDMNVDQRLSFKGPIPKYKWEENKHNHVALIAGGTGIAPMYQLCRAIFKNPNDKTKVTLCFGNIAEEDILLKRQLEDLEQEFPQRFRAFYVLEKGPEEWKGGKGYIGKELLQTVLPSPESEKIKIFVCGPPAMYKAISGTKKSPKDQGELAGILKELGYTEDQVFKF